MWQRHVVRLCPLLAQWGNWTCHLECADWGSSPQSWCPGQCSNQLHHQLRARHVLKEQPVPPDLWYRPIRMSCFYLFPQPQCFYFLWHRNGLWLNSCYFSTFHKIQHLDLAPLYHPSRDRQSRVPAAETGLFLYQNKKDLTTRIEVCLLPHHTQNSWLDQHQMHRRKKWRDGANKICWWNSSTERDSYDSQLGDSWLRDRDTKSERKNANTH